MGKGTKRKAKKRNLRPPLTFLDKSIYFFGIILSCAVSVLLAMCFEYVKDTIAYSRPETIAFIGNASYWFALPVIFLIGTSAIILLACGWEEKKPIFGSKKYKYGEYPFNEDCIPLFSFKKHRREKAPYQRSFARMMILLWCCAFIVFACLIPLSLFGGDAMYQDYHVERINLVNNVSDTYTTDDFSELTIQARYVSPVRGSGRWKYEIIIKMKDGKTVSFSNRDFDSRVPDVKDNCLNRMMEIKNLFAQDSITVKGAEKLEKVSDYFNFNEQQQAKLKQLFAQ